ncbi:MAG: RES domain-containing protein [Planctomycetes bacterium]|nr:RES domain-containing protein [Planctomycetota bacterium]
MKLSAWRIVKAKRAASGFTGEGARRAGGRWNSPGIPIVYTASTASLAMLEMLVHIESQDLLNRYVLFEVSFDEALVETVKVKELPRTWRKSPTPAAIRQVGDEWAGEQRSVVLRVPSVVVPTEWNYLLNPAHPEFAKIAIGPRKAVKFDPRLIKPPSASTTRPPAHADA